MRLSWALFFACIGLTIAAFARIAVLSATETVAARQGHGGDRSHAQDFHTITAELVWWYGWITCASTALGVLPLIVFRCVSSSPGQADVAPEAVIAAAPDQPSHRPSLGVSVGRKAKATPPSTVVGEDENEESRAVSGAEDEGQGEARVGRGSNRSTRVAVARKGSRARRASGGSKGHPGSVVRRAASQSSHNDEPEEEIDQTLAVPARNGSFVSKAEASTNLSLTATAVSPGATDSATSATRALTGYSNAIAGGMMIAASIALAIEGSCHTTAIISQSSSSLASSEDAGHRFSWQSALQVALGLLLGLLFVKATESFLERWEARNPGGIEALMGSSSRDAKRLLLIFAVMTLHSAAEGIGLGVSFGVKEESEHQHHIIHDAPSSMSSSSSSSVAASTTVTSTFGPFISAALAVHNAPEGLLIASQLLPSSSSATPSSSSSAATAGAMPMHVVALWCVFSSLPQPITAVPAFLLVHYFAPLLSLGLGFAAGAMSFVSIFELLPEACEALGGKKLRTGVVAVVSGLAMAGLQAVLK